VVEVFNECDAAKEERKEKNGVPFLTSPFLSLSVSY